MAGRGDKDDSGLPADSVQYEAGQTFSVISFRPPSVTQYWTPVYREIPFPSSLFIHRIPHRIAPERDKRAKAAPDRRTMQIRGYTLDYRRR